MPKKKKATAKNEDGFYEEYGEHSTTWWKHVGDCCSIIIEKTDGTELIPRGYNWLVLYQGHIWSEGNTGNLEDSMAIAEFAAKIAMYPQTWRER